MKYFIVTININTGWHETFMQRLITAKSLFRAQNIAKRACKNWWGNPDEFTPVLTPYEPVEISLQDYNAMKDYIDKIE